MEQWVKELAGLAVRAVIGSAGSQTAWDPMEKLGCPEKL